MADIKPIETYYKGYRFRSRLEARWAVLFDALGVEYEYEPEGFEMDTDDGKRLFYLPDFYLPVLDIYAEVKGAACRGGIPKEDAIKISYFLDSEHSPFKNGIIFLGRIPNPGHELDIAIWRRRKEKLVWGYTLFNSFDYIPDPNEEWPDDLRESKTPHYFNKTDDLVLTSSMTSYIPFYYETLSPPNNVWRAIEKARQARFEHGETPRT